MAFVNVKIDGYNHTVVFADDGANVVVKYTKCAGVVQNATDIHPDLLRKLTQVCEEVVDGVVKQDDVDVKWHSVG